MNILLDYVYRIIWGLPMLMLILGIGIYLSIRTGFVQLRLFPKAVGLFLKRIRSEGSESGVTGYQALCTALAATVGTGNLIGVAGAICIGGPGAVFWMWAAAFFGMATKYAEAALSVRFRGKTAEGYAGGPMYMIQNGMGPTWYPLARAYAALGMLACFGVGNMVQVRAIVDGVGTVLGRSSAGLCLLIGVCLAGLAGSILLGGVRRIADTAELIVPYAGAVYVLLCLGLLVLRRDRIPTALHQIFCGALRPKAATGGIIGSAFQAMRTGCSRGVFSNEAGLGTAGMAHGSADVSHPCEQGLMGIMEVFLDTFLICTLTGLVILCSGIPIAYGVDAGLAVSFGAFATVYGDWVTVFLTLFLCCFAFATILGWGLYGMCCARFLLGKQAEKACIGAQVLAVLIGSMLKGATAWRLAEIGNGLMAVPNLIALAWLSPQLLRLTKEYETGGVTAIGGTYADFHQRQPLRTLSYEKISPSGCRGGRQGQENLSSEHRPA